ncbi:S-layer homology domain-containing protein [Paenibacillus sp. NPDC058071]|uniref:S-layer homology domain-containing protein n=1 Tax=Paenibacillus sp. NPDC058071 TaxID=3346326 RepID=UPI0036D8A084
MPTSDARKKIIAGALALTLLSSGTATLLPVSSVYAAVGNTTFTDVSAGHWAEKHIAKLSLQGIVNGYSLANGTSEFRPAKSITQEEAVVMALRFAGLEKQASVSDVIAFPESFKVGGYFKPFIKLAFDKGFLDQSEEFGIAEGNGGKGWGGLPATREWVTKLLVRAIGEDATAKQLSLTASSFADDSQIASNYRGYVNAAVSLGLVKGVTADKFDPKAPVNRMSLAALISRAEPLYPVQYEGQATGIVTKKTDSSITIFADGTEKTYTIASNSMFYRHDSETAVTAASVQLYTDITIIGALGQAQYVEILGDTQKVETIKAKFERNVQGSKYFYVWINEEPVKINYDTTTAFTDLSGNPIDISAVKRDSTVTILQDKFRSTPVAMKVVVEQQMGAGKVNGQLLNVDKTVVTYLNSKKELVSKFLADNVEITVPGIEAPTVDDLLKEVDNVELTLNDEEKVTKITVVNRNVKTLVGATVDNYNPTRRVLTVYDSSGKNGVLLNITERTKIDYNGTPVKVTDLPGYMTKDRKLSVTYSGDMAVSISFIYKQTGKVLSVNTNSNTITLELTGGSKVTLPYDSPVVEIPGQTYAYITDIAEGSTVTAVLNASQDKISTLQVHKTLQYEIKSISTTAKRVNALSSNGVLTELYLANISLSDETGKKISFENLAIGMYLNVSYAGKQLQSAQTLEFTYGKVQSVTSSGIAVTLGDGTTKNVAFTTNYRVLKGSQKGNYSLIQNGDYVETYRDETNALVVTIAVAETRTYTDYTSYDSTLWVLKKSSTDNANFYVVAGDTKVTHKGATISIFTLKAGDQLQVLAVRNRAFEIVKL